MSITKLYKMDCTITFAVEANDRAEAQREINKLLRETHAGLAVGVSMLAEPANNAGDLRGVYVA